MRKSRLLVVTGVLGLLPFLGLAASGPAMMQPAPGTNYLGQIVDEGHYLKGLAGLERDAERAPSSQNALDLARSFVLGSTTDYVPPNAGQCPDQNMSEIIQGAQPTDALSEIVRRARNSRIVILNENHFEPRHRAFGLQVARALRRLGYRHLAIEGLSNHPTDESSAQSMAELARRGYVVHSTGIYTNEPMFADFIRQALSLGYQPYAYDGSGSRDTTDRVAAREEFQAQTINQRVITANPEGKILIYVGFRHVTEAPFDGGLGRQMEWMAARLKRITGLDPLTIDQREQVNSGCLPRMAIQRGLRASRFGDVILRRNGANVMIGSYQNAVDLQVIHLPVPPVHGRPAWMTQVGRRPLPIPARLLGNRTRRLVQAFNAASSPDAVPVDQILIQPGQTNPPPLMVPNRNVILRAQDEEGGG